jgi:hypothetical protein
MQPRDARAPSPRAARRPAVTRSQARTDAARRALAELPALLDTIEDDAAWRDEAIARRALAACRAIRDAQTRSQETAALALACSVADEAE